MTMKKQGQPNTNTMEIIIIPTYESLLYGKCNCMLRWGMDCLLNIVKIVVVTIAVWY